MFGDETVPVCRPAGRDRGDNWDEDHSQEEYWQEEGKVRLRECQSDGI